MRLTLADKEVFQILALLYENETKDNKILSNKIRKQWNKPIKLTKKNATKKAIEFKQQATKNKIQNAINLMRLEGEKITIYSVAKKAGVSYNSAKKYSYIFLKSN